MTHQLVHKLTESGIFHSQYLRHSSITNDFSSMGDFMRYILAEKHPDSKLTEIKTGRNITYSHLLAVASQVSTRLLEVGVEKRSSLHIVAENGFDWLVILIASYLGGYVIGASSPFSPWPEFSRNITTQCATILVMTRDMFEKFQSEIDHPYLSKLIITDAVGDETDFGIEVTVKNLPPSQTPNYDQEELDDVCEFLFSSGTTGVPKAVKITHKMIIRSCERNSLEGSLGYTTKSKFMLTNALSHVGGQIFGFLIPAFHGANFVVGSNPGFIGQLEIIEKYKITHINPSPANLNCWAKYDQLENRDLSSLEYILVGSACPNFDLIDTFIQRSGLKSTVKLRNTYGATETASCTFCQNEFIESDFRSIGIAAPGISFKVIDPQNEFKVITEPNFEGELLINLGFDNRLLYFNDPVKSRNALSSDGFYKTGDLVKLDERFQVYLSGRISEIIKYCGSTVSPALLEQIVMESDLVVDCAVIGKPDEMFVELPTACVVLSEKGKLFEEREIRKMLLDHVAGHVQEQRRIREVFVVKYIPRNPNEKIMRGVLVKQISAGKII